MRTGKINGRGEIKMKRMILLLTAVFTIGAFFMSCGKSAERQEFVNEDPWFSFEYPGNYTAEPLKNPSEAARFAASNMYKLPVVTANVYDRGGNFNQSDITEDFIGRMKRSIPGVSGFEIIEEKTVELSDGTDANFARLKWNWTDGETPLETILVTSLKGDKVITLTGTVFYSQDLSDEVEKLCLTLKVDPDA